MAVSVTVLADVRQETFCCIENTPGFNIQNNTLINSLHLLPRFLFSNPLMFWGTPAVTDIVSEKMRDFQKIQNKTKILYMSQSEIFKTFQANFGVSNIVHFGMVTLCTQKNVSIPGTLKSIPLIKCLIDKWYTLETYKI